MQTRASRQTHRAGRAGRAYAERVSTSDDGPARSESGDFARTDAIDAALAAAVTNAALEGIDVEADEQALIRLHQSGGIDHAEFLRRAQALAERKSGGGRV